MHLSCLEWWCTNNVWNGNERMFCQYASLHDTLCMLVNDVCNADNTQYRNLLRASTDKEREMFWWQDIRNRLGLLAPPSLKFVEMESMSHLFTPRPKESEIMSYLTKLYNKQVHNNQWVLHYATILNTEMNDSWRNDKMIRTMICQWWWVMIMVTYDKS